MGTPPAQLLVEYASPDGKDGPGMTTIQRIKRMGRILGKAVQVLFGIILLYVLSSIAVKLVTGRDLQDAFRFPEVVVLPFWFALSLLLVAALLVICIVNLSDRLDQIPDHLTDVHSALNDLLPLIEEGQEIRSLKYQREADQLISEEARARAENPPTSSES